MSKIGFDARELSPRDAKDLLDRDFEIQLVDVRTHGEHQEARIPGSKHIPLHTLPARLGELDKKKPVLFYCAAGGRSGQALGFAESQGYAAAHILGGISSWAGSGLPYES
jgi:rhodanese-related sulfurtransferase